MELSLKQFAYEGLIQIIYARLLDYWFAARISENVEVSREGVWVIFNRES